MKKTLSTSLFIALAAPLGVSCIEGQRERVAQEDSLRLPQEELLDDSLHALQDSLSLDFDSLSADSAQLSSDSLPSPASSKL